MQRQAEQELEEQAERIYQMEDELKQKRENTVLQNDESPSFTWSDVTKLHSATIVDVEPSRTGGQVTFTVEVQDEGTEEIILENPDEYTHEYELVRLIEWSGDGYGEIGSLLNKDVTLVERDGDYAFYLPYGLDTWNRTVFRADNFARRMGVRGVQAFQNYPPEDKWFVGAMMTLIGMGSALISMLIVAETNVLPSVLALSFILLSAPLGVLLPFGGVNIALAVYDHYTESVAAQPNVK